MAATTSVVFESFTVHSLPAPEQHFHPETDEEALIERSIKSFDCWLKHSSFHNQKLPEKLFDWLSDRGCDLIKTYTQFCLVVHALRQKPECASLTLPPEAEFQEHYPFLQYSPKLAQELGRPQPNQSIKGLIRDFEIWMKDPRHNHELSHELLNWIFSCSHEYIHTYEEFDFFVKVLIQKEEFRDLVPPSKEEFSNYSSCGLQKKLEMFSSIKPLRKKL
jgi:hypothetical protein